MTDNNFDDDMDQNWPETRDDEDENMQDDGEEDLVQSQDAEEEKRKRESDAESRIYFEPVDLTRENVYHVRDFDEHTQKHRWKLTDFSKGRIYSPVFESGGVKWKILCFPKGNNVSFMSIYLACEDVDTRPISQRESWYRSTRFQLSVINQKVLVNYMVLT
jgi:hypothetical protein